MTGKRFQPPCGKLPRRAFLQDCGMGFAGLVLAAMNGRADTAGWRPPDGKPHSAPVFTGKLIETVPAVAAPR